MPRASQFIKSFLDVARRSTTIRKDGLQIDAGETTMLARQLEHMMSEFFDIMEPENKIRQFFPVDNSVNTGAESVTYRQYQKLGEAKIIAKYSDDLPLVNVLGREFNNKVIPLGDAYELSIQSIRGAAMAGVPLDAMLADTCRMVIEQAIDRIGALGDTEAAIQGFVNHSSIGLTVATTGGWDTASAAQIIADVQKLWNAIRVQSLELHNANTLLVPANRWEFLQQPRSTTTDTTVLTWLLQNLEGVQNIDKWHRLNTAGAAGVTRAMAYERSPRNGRLNIPQEFEQFPPQERNLAFVVPCHARIAGAIVTYPLAFEYMDSV